MLLEQKLNKNINDLYSKTKWIKQNEYSASIGDIPTKTNYVNEILNYETIRKDTIILLELYFKEERTPYNLEYRRIYRKLKTNGSTN